ncbi:phage tail assembly chaperone [Budvicia aquatica]|uniref:phage tail assembly chaperone n=1 Tax=Budvicia aquatica TaxID=82979 RepID=UPI000426ED21
MWKTTGKKPAKLLALDRTILPEELSYIYQWFSEFYSGQPFSYSELESWCRLTGRHLDIVEIDLIKRLVFSRNGISP